ncbi:MAG: PIN domain-containing protein [Firmicutes bacterium]|nr:PIN domain-containing protein [Bacillota bacterium]
MQIWIDANIILRYLTNDDEEKATEAEKLIQKKNVWVLAEVIAEVVYTLKGKVYQIPRNEIAEAITGFLDEVNVNNKNIIVHALKLFGDTSLDFVDCILISYNQINDDEVISWDKKLIKHLKPVQ